MQHYDKGILNVREKIRQHLQSEFKRSDYQINMMDITLHYIMLFYFSSLEYQLILFIFLSIPRIKDDCGFMIRLK